MRVCLVAAGMALGAVFAACAGSDPDPVRPAKGTDAGSSSGDPIAAFTIAVSPATLLLPKNGQATLDVQVTRRSTSSEAITITASGLPEGVNQDPLAIAGDSGTLTLHAKNAPLVARTINLTATSGTDVAASSFALTVQGLSGDKDVSFDMDGEADYLPDGATFEPVAVVTQDDGKSVLGGTYRSANGDRFHLLRLNDDGSLDATFGVAGTTAPEDAAEGTMHAMIRDGRGGFLAAGSVRKGGTGAESAAMLRFDASGKLDPNFAGSFLTLGTSPTSADHAVWHDVALGADGTIVLAGSYVNDTSGKVDGLLARYGQTGQLDTSFGDASSGWLRFRDRTSSVDTGFNTAVVQSDGHIVAAGWFVPDGPVPGAKTKSYAHRFDATGKTNGSAANLSGQQQVTSPGVGFVRALRNGTADDAIVVGETLASGGVTSIVTYQLAKDGGDGLPGNNFAVSDEDHVVAMVAAPDAQHLLALGSAHSGAELQPIVIRLGVGGFDKTFGGAPAAGSIRALPLGTKPGGLAIVGDSRVVVTGSTLTGQTVIQRIWL